MRAKLFSIFMNIGFDLDKVFIDYPPLVPNWLINKLYKDKENGELRYRMPGKIEQKIRQLSHNPILRRPIMNNLEFLDELAKNNTHNLFLISSRFNFLKNRTEKLAKKLKFYDIFKDMHFNFENKQPHIFKNEVLTELKLDRYIDDDLSLIKFLAKHQPKTHFYWLNQQFEKTIGHNIKAVKSIRNMLE